MTLYCLVVLINFRKTFCLHFQVKTITLFYEQTRRNIPEDLTVQLMYCFASVVRAEAKAEYIRLK